MRNLCKGNLKIGFWKSNIEDIWWKNRRKRRPKSKNWFVEKFQCSEFWISHQRIPKLISRPWFTLKKFHSTRGSNKKEYQRTKDLHRNKKKRSKFSWWIFYERFCHFIIHSSSTYKSIIDQNEEKKFFLLLYLFEAGIRNWFTPLLSVFVKEQKKII